MRQAFVYRLYPSRSQERAMEAILTTTRSFYNSLLAERKQAWEERGERVTKVHQLRRVKERKATNPYAASVHSHILQVVADDLDKAFRAFFRRVRGGEKPGYPRFRTRKAACAGRWAVCVDPSYTSKHCSGCGERFRQEITLAVRWVTCETCGLSLDRDHNAAINILNRARSVPNPQPARTSPLGANVAGLPACVVQEAAPL